MNSLTKIQDEILKIFDDKELTDEGKSKILAQLQERFGFLLNKFKNAGLPPANVLPLQPALPLPAHADHVGDGPPAGVVEADTEGYFSPRESVHEEEGNASTEILSTATSLKDLTTSSNASFLTVSSIREATTEPFFLLASREKSTKAMNIWALVSVECWPWRKIRVALLDDQGKHQSKPSRYA